MKTNVTKLEDCKVKLTVEVDADTWQNAQKKAKGKGASKVNIKGFRKGHVPAAMAEKYIRQEDVINEALRGIIDPTYAEALRNEKLNPFDQASVNVSKLTDKELTLEFSFTHGPHVDPRPGGEGQPRRPAHPRPPAHGLT